MSQVPYRYPAFRRELLYHDVSFEKGPAPGQPFPDFDLPTTDGGRITRRDTIGGRPLLMVFSSYT